MRQVGYEFVYKIMKVILPVLLSSYLIVFLLMVLTNFPKPIGEFETHQANNSNSKWSALKYSKDGIFCRARELEVYGAGTNNRHTYFSNNSLVFVTRDRYLQNVLTTKASGDLECTQNKVKALVWRVTGDYIGYLDDAQSTIPATP